MTSCLSYLCRGGRWGRW
ncbi:hypothetical protein E2C01_041147 [Portunus trituberculatus]|uniref:Uncharacterized protein n=1 Tax=Portunus trituberculatus TaxID=210409 RepID=A0A5B7FQW5_PORTR|nr:hypothetical protein [Portunus trituberculatus]